MSLYNAIEIPDWPAPDNIERLDLMPVPQIIRMMRVGIAVDREALWSLGVELSGRLKTLRREALDCVPEEALTLLEDKLGLEADDDDDDASPVNLDSPDQLCALLYDVLQLGKGKRIKRTSSGTRLSTGKKSLEILKEEHPVIRKLLEYREVAKIKSTYCDGLPKRAVRHTKGLCGVCGLWHQGAHWRIHGTINTTRTVPGRLSMKQPNLQQIPSRTELGRRVRAAFIAAPGCRLVSRDYSQLHLRLLAWLGGVERMLKVFRVGGDIHVETARAAFGLRPDEEPDKLTQRNPSKTVNFLIVYGGQGQTLYETLIVNFALAGIPAPDWLTLEWCNRFIATWFSIYSEAEKYFGVQHWRARRYGAVWCQFGRVRRVPEVQSAHERVVQAGLRQAGNHPIIGTEAGFYKIAQARIERVLEAERAKGAHAEAVVPVHDELILETDERIADDLGDVVGAEMVAAFDDESGECVSTCPIETDGHSMERWEK